MTSENNSNVENRAESKLSDLWKNEDYLAIWFAFFILAEALLVFIVLAPDDFKKTIDKSNVIMASEAARAPFQTIAYLEAQSAKKKVSAANLPESHTISKFLAAPSRWDKDILSAFYVSEEVADEKTKIAKEKRIAAQSHVDTLFFAARITEKTAEKSHFNDTNLNKLAIEAIKKWQAAKKQAEEIKNTSPKNIFFSLTMLMVTMALFFGLAIALMGKNFTEFSFGFIGLFLLATLAITIGNQSTMRYYGIGGEPWAIIVGLLIANTIGTPRWIKNALEVELFIKMGLVLLGAEILLDKILAIGVPGIFVAWVVTPIVLVGTFVFGQRLLKISSPSLNMVISADLSVCGTSAAIATAAACHAKKEELTVALGLSLAFTAVMMVAMPAFIHLAGMPEILGGAWIGGTIDSTGAVAAAGALLGEDAMYVAVTIKMIQNILIGVVALGVAVYWSAEVDNTEGHRVRIGEIWHRFPKFVIGFLTASVVFSAYSTYLGPDLGSALINDGIIRSFEAPLRSWFFVLAFTAIGLSSNFRELSRYFQGGKPLILYIVGQLFNLALTLGMAWLMFYKIFPEVGAGDW